MEKTGTPWGSLIGIALIAVLALGGIAYMGMEKGEVSGTALPPSGTVVQTNANAKGSSLKDLLARTEPTKCTVTSSNDTQKSDGLVYIADGKMRTDFTTTVTLGPAAGRVMIAHMIIDTDTSYMWGDNPEMKMGIKMAKKEILDVEPKKGMDAPSNLAAIDMNEKSDYDCANWQTDKSVFVPPADIQFTDMSAMGGAMMQMPTKGAAPASSGARTPSSGMSAAEKAAMCGACDQAGSGKSECRAALGCK